jgi:4a-hydroxytetrahydrobiopterin dehydratase
MARPGRLNEGEITSALAKVPGWTRKGEEIQRAITAPSFPAGIDLVTQVARAAEEADHHPDIDIRWRTVTFTLSTHSAGGLTILDFQLAAHIDALAVAWLPESQ